MSVLRSGVHALGRLLSASPHAIYAVDDQSRIVHANLALEQLLGLTNQQLLGQRCAPDAKELASPEQQVLFRLCPPPEAFSGQPVQQQLSIKHISGRATEQTATFVPLAADPLDEVGVLAVLANPDHDVESRLATVSEAAELHLRLIELRQALWQETPLRELIGTSAAVRRVQHQVRLVQGLKTRVLVCGPRGSGREQVARLIHRRGQTDQVGPTVPLCCPLMDAELLQTTVRAFLKQFATSPAESWPSLLLVDVDQLPHDAQRELAGLFELPDFELNTVATSERPLLDLARQGDFLMELASTLSTFVIELPSLSERREDIPLLCQQFLEAFNKEHDQRLSGFSREAMDELVGYEWPDNLDELNEVVEQSCQAADGSFVEVQHLADPIRAASSAAAHPVRPDAPIVFDDLMTEIETKLIRHALQRSKGNKTRAAQLLGMSRARLHRRIELLGLS